MRYKAVLFDFDGTLADSERLMLQTLNSLSHEFGFAPLRDEELQSLRALSMRQFITARLRIPLWRIWKLRRLERMSKERFVALGEDPALFRGVQELIRGLRSRGCMVGIVSSAPRVVIERVLATSGLEVDFVHAGIETLRKATGIRSALAQHRLAKEQVVYVGDELRDLAACKKAGIPMLGVAWGLNDALTLQGAGLRIASTPEELLSMLTA